MRRLLTLLLLYAPLTLAQTSTVTWTNVHQTIDGFGGNCSNTCGTLTSAQGTQLFSATAGAGLSIYRDEIPFDFSCQTTCVFISTPAINQAKANGVTTFFATAWSAPPSTKVINVAGGT